MGFRDSTQDDNPVNLKKVQQEAQTKQYQDQVKLLQEEIKALEDRKEPLTHELAELTTVQQAGQDLRVATANDLVASLTGEHDRLTSQIGELQTNLLSLEDQTNGQLASIASREKACEKRKAEQDTRNGLLSDREVNVGTTERALEDQRVALATQQQTADNRDSKQETRNREQNTRGAQQDHEAGVLSEQVETLRGEWGRLQSFENTLDHRKIVVENSDDQGASIKSAQDKLTADLVLFDQRQKDQTKVAADQLARENRLITLKQAVDKLSSEVTQRLRIVESLEKKAADNAGGQ